MVGLEHYLSVAAALFVIGIFGLFLNRKNVIILLMSIELMLLAVNINLVAFSAHLNDLVGQVFTMFILTVAAAEAAIGLAILVCFFRNRGTIDVEDVNVMRGNDNANNHPLCPPGWCSDRWLWLAHHWRQGRAMVDHRSAVSGGDPVLGHISDV